MKNKQRRRFTREFRADAIRLVVNEGKSVKSVAQDLGIGVSTLSAWIRSRSANGHTLTGDESKELIALRKENRILRMEREILKKAAAFFAKESK